MMKRLVILAAVLGVSAVTASTALALPRLRGGCSPCSTSCATPCAQNVQYVDKKVTAYKSVWKEKEVECTVMKPVTKWIEEKVPCTVMERRVEKKTIKENYNECVTVQEPCTYTVMEQKIEAKKQIVTSYKCVTKQVQECVPVCRRVRVCCVDPCTGCGRMVWTTVTENVTRCRNVVERIPVQTEVTCNVVTCVPVQKQGTRNVVKMVPKTRDVVCEVVTCVPVQKVNVVRRCVTECVAEKVKQKVSYCEVVPYETTVKVAVCTPCPTPCPAPCTTACAPPCPRTGLFAKLFQRKNCCASACGTCCN